MRNKNKYFFKKVMATSSVTHAFPGEKEIDDWAGIKDMPGFSAKSVSKERYFSKRWGYRPTLISSRNGGILANEEKGSYQIRYKKERSDHGLRVVVIFFRETIGPSDKTVTRYVELEHTNSVCFSLRFLSKWYVFNETIQANESFGSVKLFIEAVNSRVRKSGDVPPFLHPVSSKQVSEEEKLRGIISQLRGHLQESYKREVNSNRTAIELKEVMRNSGRWRDIRSQRLRERNAIELERVKVEFSTSVASLRAEIGNLQEQLREKSEESRGLTEINTAIRKANDEFVSTIETLRTEKDSLRTGMSHLEKEVAGLREEYGVARENNARLELLCKVMLLKAALLESQ